jgi:hypothetical protein
MNLKITVILCIISIFSLQAQVDCQYEQVELSKNKHISLIRTGSVMVDNSTTAEKGRVIDFSLVNSKGIIVLNMEVYKDAKQVLTPACIGKDARLSFKLANGDDVVLPQVGARLCGFELVASEPGFYNIKNRGSFLITDDKFKQLKENDLISMNLTSENFSFYAVIQDILYDDVDNKIIEPTKFFIDYLDCVVNPQIIIQD